MKQDSSGSSGLSLARLRPFVQGAFLVGFIGIFVSLTYPLKSYVPTNFFFDLDPLIVFAMALSGSAVAAGLVFSAVTVVATLLFGRIFCGWLCPMGTIFDLAAKIIPARKGRSPVGAGKFKNAKYYLLAFLVAGSACGFTALMMLDPLVFLFRALTMSAYPFAILLANLGLNAARPLTMKMGAYTLAGMSLEQPAYALGLLSLVMFAAAIGLVAYERRFWCRNLCPLGALLSLFARFSIWGRRVDDACIGCSKCARACPMNAIGKDYHATSLRECIQCNRCEPVCLVNAISFPLARTKHQRFEFNPSRRGVLAACAGGVVAGLAAASSTATQVRRDTLLRPPGALVEMDFLDACLRCGECMKVCPTHALQPAKLEAGFEGLFTPVLTPRVGACEENCNLCGQVCPTGAIRKLPLEEKKYVIIGNAVIDRTRCIAWEQLKVCLICDEVCPYDAIEFNMVTDEKGTLQRPFVIEDKCVGCGQCEHGCPVNGPAAIHITPINEVRQNTGSYITEKVQKLREVDDTGHDFYTPGAPGQEGAAPSGAPVPDDGGLDLDAPPPGLLFN